MPQQWDDVEEEMGEKLFCLDLKCEAFTALYKSLCTKGMLLRTLCDMECQGYVACNNNTVEIVDQSWNAALKTPFGVHHPERENCYQLKKFHWYEISLV